MTDVALRGVTKVGLGVWKGANHVVLPLKTTSSENLVFSECIPLGYPSDFPSINLKHTVDDKLWVH